MANNRRRMINSTVVGVTFVDGSGPFKISYDEKVHIMAEVREGLEKLKDNEPDANITWTTYAKTVKILNPEPWKGAAWPGKTANYQRGYDRFYRGPDAAFWSEKDKMTYLFSGDMFAVVDPTATRVNGMVRSGYPMKIAAGWPTLPNNFKNGIDAAVWCYTNSRVYFFKGNEYVRINPYDSWRVESGYPAMLPGGWKGLPASFTQGIDAAFSQRKPLNREEIYIFRGDRYVRINPADGFKSLGPSKRIRDGWRSLPEDYQKGIDAALFARGKTIFFKKKRIEGTYISMSALGGAVTRKARPIGLKMEDAEKQWRDPALVKMGYKKGKTGINQYVSRLQRNTGAESGFICFFTKFPFTWHAWASGKVVMHRRIASGPFTGWTSVDSVTAHETGHMFGAPDEYSAACDDCGEKSKKGYFFSKANSNCEACNPNSVNCLMKNDTISQLCSATPGHFGWGAFMTGLDAALYIPAIPNVISSTNFYLFSNDHWIRVNAKDRKMQGHAAEMWRYLKDGLPSSFGGRIDAAFWDHNKKKGYFIRGDRYIRFTQSAIWTSDFVQPRKFSLLFDGLPSNFASDIDAVLKVKSTLYIFKGNKFAKFQTVGSKYKISPGYPKLISSYWRGLPPAFQQGIDAAVYDDSNNNHYFFKGKQFVRMKPNQAVNGPQPARRSINGLWNIPFPSP